MKTGFSDDEGSWKIIEIRRPRICRIRFGGSSSRFRPSNSRRPDVTTAVLGNSRRIDNPVTVLPQPDSPTMPTNSPPRTSSDTPSTARRVRRRVRNSTRRSSTVSNASPDALHRNCLGSKTSRSASPTRLNDITTISIAIPGKVEIHQ